MRDLQQTKRLLMEADQFIANHPEVLNMSTDGIFHELDNGTEEMKHLRWGVMTRVKTKELNVDTRDIVDSLSDISDRGLMCEYIGFVLQQEKDIDLLDLLLKAHKKGKVNEIIPFIIEVLPFEGDCHIEDIDDISKSIECVEDSINKSKLIRSYAELIVKKGEEDKILDIFIETSDRLIGQLILEMRRPLKCKDNEKYKKWEKVLVEDKREQLIIIGIQYIGLSNTLSEDIDQYYHVLKLYRNNDEFMIKLIPIYMEYLRKNTGSNISEIICDIIQCLKEKRKKVINSLINSLYLADGPCEKIEKILEALFHINLNDFMELLSKADYSLAEIYSNRPNLLFGLICNAFVSNHISWTQSIWKKMPSTRALLQMNCQSIISDWLDFIDGTNYEYLFAISCIGTIIDINLIYKRICESEWSEQRVLDFLEGCCLFMTPDSNSIELLFLFADYIEDQKMYSEYCYDNAYMNYPGKTITVAERYLESRDGKKSELSKRLIEMNNRKVECLKKGCGIKDFMPSSFRLQIYHKVRRDDIKTISKKAKDESVFSRIFPSRVIKYGNRTAFVQRDNDKCFFRVSPFINSNYSIEIPTRELLYPLEMIQKREAYLERRGNITYEIDS